MRHIVKIMINGKKISLVPATLDDRRKVYEWCFHSDTTKSHSGPPDYPEIPIVTYAEFCDKHYEDYFFTGSRPRDGRGFLITHQAAPVGFISYSSFHLRESLAEFDIWMNCETNCGKGFGVDALVALGDFLNGTMDIHRLIIAPSNRNVRAIKSYEKAGFKKSDKAMSDFLLDEYVDIYGGGDYGIDGTAILEKRFKVR